MRHTAFFFAALLITACDEGAKLDDTASPGAIDDTEVPADDTDSTSTGEGPHDDTDTTIEPVGLAIALPDGSLLDPTLDGDPALRIFLTASQDCSLRLSIDGYTLADDVDDALETTWDGALDEAFAEPGAYTLRAEADCDDDLGVATAEATLVVADLHLAALNFTGVAEATDGHVPLAYHKLAPDTPGVTVLAEDLPEYWAPSPDSAPATWDDVQAPPWGPDEDPLDDGHNVPAAYVAGALPVAILRPGDLPDSAPAVRLYSDFWADAHDFEPDADVVLTGAEPLPPTLGRQDLITTWRFEAEGPDGDWLPVPGSLETTHRLYLVADASALEDGTGVGAAPDVPWIAVLEEIDAAVSGLPAETADVLDALREFIYTNPDYVYNPGDRAYSTYEGDYAYWDWIAFEMTDWLDHNDGVDMYCHSTSCMLSVLAATVGVDAPQYVIGHNFTTNLLLPAGGGDWDTWGFYSHSVASPDGGETIWDAAVMVDGDGDPTRFPVTAAPVNGVSFEDYFFGLTTYDVDFVHTTACYIQ